MSAHALPRVATTRPTPRGLAAALRDWLLAVDRRYHDRQALARLDDRLLRDIGVTRADVAAELRRPLL